MILNEMSDGLLRRVKFTDFKVIIVARDVDGADRIIKCEKHSSREEAVERLKGWFNHFVNSLYSSPVEIKLLDMDKLYGLIKYRDGSALYMDIEVEVNASLVNSDISKQQKFDEKKMYSAMSVFSMTGNAQVRRIIAKHTAELANGQPCTIKFNYKEVDKRGFDGYAGYDLYFVDDVSIPEWMYNDLKSVFMEE